jgi:hypothetical protein
MSIGNTNQLLSGMSTVLRRLKLGHANTKSRRYVEKMLAELSIYRSKLSENELLLGVMSCQPTIL